MLVQKGGFALNNFVDTPSTISSLSIPLGLQYLPIKDKKLINYDVKVNSKSIENNTYNNMLSLLKPSSFNYTRKNKIKFSKKTRKNKK